MKSNFLLHLHPKKISSESLKFSKTFGLGGISFLLFIILFLSGILLRFYYIPTPEKAYDSLEHIRNEVFFGSFIRNVHYWAAIGMLLVCVLHLLRIFFGRAFLLPRRSNWVIGVILLVGVILCSFTGYLLPWDQLAYWAVQVGTHMLQYVPFVGKGLYRMIVGGNEVGQATLLNFYTLHTSVIPMAIFILMIYHIWKVRKAKGIQLPENAPSEMEDTYPNLVIREAAVAAIVVALLFVLSALIPAPLGDQANPQITPNPVKAPWYFMGLQELLLHFPPVGAVLIPLAALAGLIMIPFLKNNQSRESVGIYFISEKGKKTAIWCALIAVVLVPVLVTIDDLLRPVTSMWTLWLGKFAAGLFPFIVLIGIPLSVYAILRKKYKATVPESLQAIVVFLLFALVMLTIVGTFFRVENMKLLWL